MVNITGLSTQQAQEKLKEFGLNEIREVNKISPLKILFRQVRANFVIYLLTITTVFSFFLGKHVTAYVILGVIFIVVSTGFFQEYKAEKAISSLKKLITPISKVIRDRREQEIESSKIVPGDILVLRTGERIPADCVVLDESDVRVNESILTGESKDVSKFSSSTEDYTDENLVFMGAYITSGKCIAQVIHTGMNTKFGAIAGMISTAEKNLPLQDKVNTISKYMATIGLSAAFITGLVLFLRAETITGEVIASIMVVIIALAVSSFPEGFPVVLTATLAAGMNRMAKQNAVVNRMSIIETLGETSVICTDKTGTITKGEMTVRKIFSDNTLYEVEGLGYETSGSILDGKKQVVLEKHPALKQLLKSAVLCNDTSIQRLEDSEDYKVLGSSTEGALLIAAAKSHVYTENFKLERIDETQFNSERKMMSVLTQEDNKQYVYAKGAPEVLIAKCTHILEKGKIVPLTKTTKETILSLNNDMAANALRSLAFAYKVHDKKGEYTEDGLIFLGIAAMEDPPRDEVKPAIQLCMDSGIRVKMITGDNKETALAIAKQVGLEGNILSGNEINELTDDELSKVVKDTVIFARVQPEHKLRIVKALKEQGEIVTMTGDGVNDAPALKEAHIGVAMGISGTDVSRSVADITLKDDNFATIVTAIKEGRTVFNNIRKFVTYQLSCNLADIYILFIGMLVAPWLGWYVPIITALQILFFNIVTDNMPAIALGFNSTSKDIMKEKPRRNPNILTNEFANVILVNGIIMGMIIVCIAYLTFNILDFQPEVARTTVLLSIILMQIANAFNFRSFRYPVLSRSLFVNRYLVLASTLSVVATLVILYVPFFSTMFETTPLGITDWVIAAIAPFSVVAIFDILKLINKNNKLLHYKV